MIIPDRFKEGNFTDIELHSMESIQREDGQCFSIRCFNCVFSLMNPGKECTETVDLLCGKRLERGFSEKRLEAIEILLRLKGYWPKEMF
jgi:hypothetical protein